MSEAINNFPMLRFLYIKAESFSEEHMVLRTLFFLLYVSVSLFCQPCFAYIRRPLQLKHFNRHFSPWYNNPCGCILNAFGLSFFPLSGAWRGKRVGVICGGKSLRAILN